MRRCPYRRQRAGWRFRGWPVAADAPRRGTARARRPSARGRPAPVGPTGQGRRGAGAGPRPRPGAAGGRDGRRHRTPRAPTRRRPGAEAWSALGRPRPTLVGTDRPAPTTAALTPAGDGRGTVTRARDSHPQRRGVAPVGWRRCGRAASAPARRDGPVGPRSPGPTGRPWRRMCPRPPGKGRSRERAIPAPCARGGHERAVPALSGRAASVGWGRGRAGFALLGRSVRGTSRCGSGGGGSTRTCRRRCAAAPAPRP